MTEQVETQKRRGRPKREHTPDRPERVTLDRYSALELPAGCDTEQFAYRWCLDDNQGSIDRYLAAWYEFETDTQGGQHRRPAGNGQTLILMKLPKELAEQDQKLQESRNIDTLAAQTTMEEGDYIPDGRKFVVSADV